MRPIDWCCDDSHWGHTYGSSVPDVKCDQIRHGVEVVVFKCISDGLVVSVGLEYDPRYNKMQDMATISGRQHIIIRFCATGSDQKLAVADQQLFGFGTADRSVKPSVGPDVCPTQWQLPFQAFTNQKVFRRLNHQKWSPNISTDNWKFKLHFGWRSEEKQNQNTRGMSTQKEILFFRWF